MTKKFTRKQFLIGAAHLTAGATASWVASGLPGIIASAQAPAVTGKQNLNILIIVSDQLRHWLDFPDLSLIGAHGLEKLLEEGIGFNNFHVNTTPCSPSRAVMYCGLHTQNNGIAFNMGPGVLSGLSPAKLTIGDMVGDQGFHTVYQGKWHLTPAANIVIPPADLPNHLEPNGFSDYIVVGGNGGPHGGYESDKSSADNANNWLRKQVAEKNEKPWLLVANLLNPHDIMYFAVNEQQKSTAEFRDRMRFAPDNKMYQAKWKHPLPKSYYQDDLSTKPWLHAVSRDSAAIVYGQLDYADEELWQIYQDYYINCLRDMDQHLMSILQTLEDTGLSDNTIVVFTSDHGEMAGAHRMRQKGPWIYKENCRVPLIVRHPDIQGGSTTDAQATSVDLAPTLLGFTGLSQAQIDEQYPHLNGVDVSAATADTTARTARDERGSFFNYAIMGGWASLQTRAATGTEGQPPSSGTPDELSQRILFRGVFDGRYKFARYFKPAEHHQPKDWQTLLKYNDLEAYDTEADPDEINNIAAEPEEYRELLLALNDKVNKLIDVEVGIDDGSEHPGPIEQYNTTASG